MRLLRLALLGSVASISTSAQVDWPAYGHDAGGTKFSPLQQLNKTNVAKLECAWTYHTREKGRQFESTPLVVGGVMYVSTQQQRILALERDGQGNLDVRSKSPSQRASWRGVVAGRRSNARADLCSEPEMAG
jgi:glucose dehydrogenase